MNDQNGKNQKPDSSVDIFSMPPVDKPDPAQAGIKAEPRKVVAEKFSALSNSATKLGPVHFIGAVVVIAVVWIGWPYIFSSSPSRVLAPSEVMTNAGRVQQQYATPADAPHVTQAQNAKVISAAPASDAMTGLGAPVPLATLPAAATTSAPSAKEVELQAKVDELQGKLTGAEAQAAKCLVPASSTVAAASSKPKARRAYNVPGRDANSTLHSVKTTQFTLNTIYRDQAWIQNSERTYVVQAGDVIDGLRIVRVEPGTRQVITSLGVIR